MPVGQIWFRAWNVFFGWGNFHVQRNGIPLQIVVQQDIKLSHYIMVEQSVLERCTVAWWLFRKKSPIALVPNIVLYLFRREKDLKKQRRPHSSSRFFSPFCASFTFSVILQWSDVFLFGRFELWWNIFKKKTTVRLPYIWRRFMWWIVDPNFLED